MLRTIINVKSDENSLDIIDRHTVLSLLDLLGKLIQTDIFSVESHFHITGMVGIRHSHDMSQLENEGVHHMGRVTEIGKKNPILLSGKADYRSLLVKLDAVRLLIIPRPCRVSSSTDTSCSCIVPLIVRMIHGNGTIDIILLLLSFDRSSVFSRDVHHSHSMGCARNRLLGLRFRLWINTVCVISAGRHHKDSRKRHKELQSFSHYSAAFCQSNQLL